MNGRAPQGTASAANDARDAAEERLQGEGETRHWGRDTPVGKYLDARMSHNDQAMDQVGATAVELAEELGERVWGVVLFGSAARGKATSNSDLDLLVIADALPSGSGAGCACSGSRARTPPRPDVRDRRHRLGV